MIFNSPPVRPSARGRAGLVLVSMMLVVTSAQAAVQDITVGPKVGGVCPVNGNYSYGAAPEVQLDLNNAPPIMVAGATGDVEWAFGTTTGMCGAAGSTTITCAGNLTVTLPNPPNTSVAQSMPVTLTGKPLTGDLGNEGYLTLKVTDSKGNCASRKYWLHVIKDGSGWGDPHITTVDGVHYDFQGAGEYTALRKDGFEVQTRQRAVPTTTVPQANEYTGLPVCVSIYSAVAAHIGSHTVSLQPNLSGQPDSSSLQVFDNGQQVTLPDNGGESILRAGGDPDGQFEGRIVKAPRGAYYEFDDASGMQLVATPAYWASQQTWYLNLNVYQTSAIKGIWGRLVGDSWLPALPDPAVPGGPSIGGRPMAAEDRYKDLYEKFGKAWRVTDATSLFIYATGTNTATFTVPVEWPRLNPQSCVIQGQTAAEPTTPEIAAQACSGITDPAQKANCTFDVTVTGNTGFAQTYATAQTFRPHGAGWQPAVPGSQGTTPPKNGWPWWWWILLLILVLIIIAVLILKKKKTP